MHGNADDSAVLRILDANLNRAREALRVMEEYARFALDDATLTQVIKAARHRLARCAPPTPTGALLSSRNILEDAGRETKTHDEAVRTHAAAVATAACRRLTEALRAIEEYGKVIDTAYATQIEQLRYEAYELERRLNATASARERFGHVRLYVIITEAICANDWFETARAALEGGADCLQLREKNLSDRVLLERARKLSALCRERDRLFIVNDRPDVAAAAGAHGVHLGQDDLPVAAARRLLPPDAMVGVSTHTTAQFDAAVADVPDYIAVGPMFPTTTKPQELIAGPQVLRTVQSRTSIPVVAIGGIDERNAPEVISAGAGCLCVCRSVIAASDVTAACRTLRALL